MKKIVTFLDRNFESCFLTRFSPSLRLMDLERNENLSLPATIARNSLASKKQMKSVFVCVHNETRGDVLQRT